MKITELSEGILDTAKGIANVALSKSSSKTFARNAKNRLKRQAAAKFSSPAGVKKQKKKMVDLMLDKWIDFETKANLKQNREDYKEPDFDDWVKKFMGPERMADVQELGKKNPSDKEAEDYIKALVGELPRS